MRLRVECKKITTNPTDFVKKSMKLVLNKACENIQSQLKDKVKDLECEIHKSSSKGTITVMSSLNTNKIEFKKSNFCCKEFKDKIKLNQ